MVLVSTFGPTETSTRVNGKLVLDMVRERTDSRSAICMSESTHGERQKGSDNIHGAMVTYTLASFSTA